MPGRKQSLEEEIILRIRMCGHFLYHQTGGKTGQRRILSILLEKEQISQRELQEILDVRSASVSEILNKMEQDGRIIREREEKDKRQIRIRLTPEGRKKAESLKAAYQKLVDRMLDGLSGEEKTALFDLLNRLTISWDKIRDDPDFAPVLDQLKH